MKFVLTFSAILICAFQITKAEDYELRNGRQIEGSAIRTNGSAITIRTRGGIQTYNISEFTDGTIGAKFPEVAAAIARDRKRQEEVLARNRRRELEEKTKRDKALASNSSVLPTELEIDLGKDAKIVLVLVPAGNFLMGSPESEKNRSDDEGPQHQVTFSKPFYIGRFEVTQAQWQSVMENNPSKFNGDGNLPVESVEWEDIHKFCEKLQSKLGRIVRLPSEAEWEYACRAGTTTRLFYGDDLDYSLIEEYAWVTSNSDNKTHPVGQKKSNAFGIYDMYGNVWEWCQDGYQSSYTGASNDGSPSDALGGSHRVLRGGCWLSGSSEPFLVINSKELRSALRGLLMPVNRGGIFGFRVVAEAY